MITGPREKDDRPAPYNEKRPGADARGGRVRLHVGAGTTVHSVSPAQAARCAGPSADIPDLAIRHASDRRSLVSAHQCTRRRVSRQIVESRTHRTDGCSNSPVTLSLEPLSFVLDQA